MTAGLSRYLSNLEARISAAGDTVEGDCLRAEKAAYLARKGNRAEAKALVAQLRSGHLAKANFAVTAWISLAEGLIAYFGDIGLGARDKILRAQAFSASSELRQLDAICSAWLAQLDYSGLRPEQMMNNVRRAFELAAPGNNAAIARASLVLAQALHYARRFDLAASWYRRAQDAALADGDDATIGALMHNMAWLRMGSLRQAVHTGEWAREDDEALALLGGESMERYDDLTGARSFKELDPLLRAEVAALNSRAGDALRIYDEHLNNLSLEGASKWKSTFHAGRAWCLAELGLREQAFSEVEAAARAIERDTQIDDLAATHSRLARAYQVLGDTKRCDEHEAAARDAWDDVRTLQEHIVSIARKFELG